MDQKQLREFITATLDPIGLGGTKAVELLMLTAAVESRLGKYVRQIGNGPARGIYQMEPRTECDIWQNFITRRPDLFKRVMGLCRNGFQPCVKVEPSELEGNLFYSTAMARVFYLRFKEPLPSADDVKGMARYWKKYYNTHLGAGTVEKAVRAYRELCQ